MWVDVEEFALLKGPLCILTRRNDQTSYLNAIQGMGKATFKDPAATSLQPLVAAEPTDNDDPDHVPEPAKTTDRESGPWSATQVFIARPLSSTKITLKSCFDRYLGCDKIGNVDCAAEAAGVQVGDKVGWALQSSIWGTYLSLKNGVLRGDAEEAGPDETFLIKVQFDYIKDALDERKKQTKGGYGEISAADMEIDSLKRFHSFGKKELLGLERDTSDLARARKEGNLNEVLLERRSKLKRDKFC
ncbi:hypothetical protein HDU91_001789 [Kappamyces sp. JEL0680]|nr:hypothetical protein HDU91_001789 [Kappamyces sp. JEL0680]